MTVAIRRRDRPRPTSGSKPAKATSTAQRSSSTSTSPAATTKAPAPAPPPTSIPSELYTSPAGGYTAQVPAGEGWSRQGESSQNGIIRAVFAGPDGQQLLIDATPTMPPGFGREGRTVTQTTTLQGPLGTIQAYRFTGQPAEVCASGCVDYQLNLGGRGYAVLAGGSSSARLAARKTILSLQETAPPPAGKPAADGKAPKGGGKGGGKDAKDEKGDKKGE